MDVSEAVASRGSIRAFLDEPVDRALLERVLEKAQRSPSGGRRQTPGALHMTSPRTAPRSLRDLESAAPFAGRHIGPSPDEQAKMLAVLGAGSLEELAEQAVPEAIRATERLDLPAGLSESAVLAELRRFEGARYVAGDLPLGGIAAVRAALGDAAPISGGDFPPPTDSPAT